MSPSIAFAAIGPVNVSIGDALFMIGFGLLMSIVGLLFYRNPAWRPESAQLMSTIPGQARLVRQQLPRNSGFGSAWFGLGLIISGLGALGLHGALLLGQIVFYCGLPIIALGVVGFIWLPGFLLPAAYVRERAERRGFWVGLLRALIGRRRDDDR